MSAITKLQVVAKCSDMCNIRAFDAEGNQVAERDGYVPNFFPGEHFGDYVELDIDVATGQILNWKKPTQATLRKELK